MSTPSLPAWLLEVLPAPAPAAVLTMGDKGLEARYPDGGVELLKDLGSAYESLHGQDFAIDDSVHLAYPENSLGSLGLTVASRPGFSTLFLGMTDNDRLLVLENAYEESLRAHIRYKATPNFFNAYHYVDTHPAFWTRFPEAVESRPYDWNTSGHCERVSQFVMKIESEEQNPEAYPQGYVVALETGAHVETHDEHFARPAYTVHYHDYRLDVYALTFEDAFVRLAAELDRFFYPDGSEKPDVPHEKPAWVLDLEARIAEIEKRDEATDGDS